VFRKPSLGREEDAAPPKPLLEIAEVDGFSNEEKGDQERKSAALTSRIEREEAADNT
jgi:hypothetical protein